MAYYVLTIYDDGIGGVIVEYDGDPISQTKTLAAHTVDVLKKQISEIVEKAMSQVPQTIH